MSAHTPGPWEFRHSSGAGLGVWADVSTVMGPKFSNLIEIYGQNSIGAPKFQIFYECWVQFPKRDWEEMQEANGRLVSAAPELLAALQGVLRVADRQTDEFYAARAAIAKATGMPECQ